MRQLTVKTKTLGSVRIHELKEIFQRDHDKALATKRAKMKHEPFLPNKITTDHMDQIYITLQDVAVRQNKKYSQILYFVRTIFVYLMILIEVNYLVIRFNYEIPLGFSDSVVSRNNRNAAAKLQIFLVVNCT